MSVPARVARLRRMSGHELFARVRGAARRSIDRVSTYAVRPAWHREQLAAALADDGPLAPVRRTLARRHWRQAHEALSAHVLGRPRRFVLHASMRDEMRRVVTAEWPDAPASAARLAARLARGEYDLLGYEGLRFRSRNGREIDWHLDPVSGRRAPARFWADIPYLDPSCGDHKVIWELNRHQHWLLLGRAWWLTGDRAYRRAFLEEAASWLAANPPGFGTNWASALEVALRTLSWVWAIELYADGGGEDEEPWLPDLLLGLDTQLRHVERNLSRYFSPNTHLLGEALALYVCGRAWPEFRRAARWERVGGGVLIDESRRQVLPDGMHAERSPHYHRYALDFYLLALAVARITGDEERVTAFEPVADRMASVLRCLVDAQGQLPLIGDDDGGELVPITGRAPRDAGGSLAWAAQLLNRPDLVIGKLPEVVRWLHPVATMVRGEAAAPLASLSKTGFDAPRSTVLASSGYHVSRHGGSVLIFDAGPHGFLNGGHAHADALAVTLTARGVPLLIDPGTGTYTMDATLRTRFRSSPWHNTLSLDGRSQSRPSGPFHWATAADATARRAVLGAGFDYFEAETDAWRPLIHERALLAIDEGAWVFADRLHGTGHHRLALHWHIDPAWSATEDGYGGVLLQHPGGLGARIAVAGASLEVLQADPATGLGWAAPVYGRLVPATTLRATVEREAPAWLITTVEVDGSGSTPRALPAEVLASEPAGAAAATTRHEEGRTISLFRARAGEAVTVLVDRRRGHAITTDARALHTRLTESGHLELACLVDASFMRLEGPDPVTITAGAPVADLLVRIPAAGEPVVTSAAGARDVAVLVDRTLAGRGGGSRASAGVRTSCVESPALPIR
jgi:hypothetical protein